jgi:hypothetical protein
MTTRLKKLSTDEEGAAILNVPLEQYRQIAARSGFPEAFRIRAEIEAFRRNRLAAAARWHEPHRSF